MKTSFSTLFAFLCCATSVVARLGEHPKERRLPHWITWDDHTHYLTEICDPYNVALIGEAEIKVEWMDDGKCSGYGDVTFKRGLVDLPSGEFKNVRMFQTNEGDQKVIGGTVGKTQMVFVASDEGGKDRKLEENHRRLEDGIANVLVFQDAVIQIGRSDVLSIVDATTKKPVRDPIYKFVVEYEE